MAKGYTATRARIREILETQVGIARAVSPTPRTETGDVLDDATVPETVRATYVLQDGGNSDAKDPISYDVIMRRYRFRLRLSVFAGYDLDAAAVELSELVQSCVDALEDIGNHNRTTTGLLWTGEFQSTEQQLINERLTCSLDFAALADHEVTAISA